METELALNKMFNNVWPHLGERERRLVAASEARRIGRRGISMVSRACGLSRVTITKGLKELDEAPLAPGKTRRAGAGRPRVEKVDPGIWRSLDGLMRETTCQETCPALLWSVKSTRRLAQELTADGHRISHEKVAQILRQNGYNLQGTRCNEESRLQPDRDAQFRHVGRRAAARLAEGQPVVAIDTRRREPAFVAETRTGHGAFASSDRLLQGDCPTGIYDPQLARDAVNVETALEAAAFTTDSILGWWLIEGQELYPHAQCLMVAADGVGANQRSQWKRQMQKLAAAIGLPVEFCRFPPGTSKWNRPSQRLFSFVSSQWAGETERDYEISAKIVSPPSETRTMALGLRLDHSRFRLPTRPPEDDRALLIYPSEFHGDWNFTIRPEALGPYQLPVCGRDRLAAAM
ncbi:MAG: ISAzo13 family transposase [Deltaproteobacteria bacterium]|jgi:hypothetical protein|nr:ISAzo13 family transposase [Deltaproteobacteria bacterium]